MKMEEIGFQHGIPESQTKTWPKQIHGRTFVFKKAEERKGLFLYNCRYDGEDQRFVTAASTGFYSERNLTPEEVEVLPQFASFISGFTKH